MKFTLKAIMGILLGGLANAQAVYEGPPDGPGKVVQLDDPFGLPVVEGIRFLPLEVSGRTQLDSLDPTLAQIRDDVPLANRVLLPDGAGSLYRYQTIEPFGQVFGFLLVDPDGSARVVFEFSGWGPMGLNDPLEGFCAIEGSTFWITSVPEVGGDLFEIDLIDGTARNRTTTMEPIAFLERGLALYPTFGIAMTSTGPVRFDRLGTPAQPLAFEGVKPDWFAPDIVSSPDGSTFAFVAGLSETQTHVYYGREGGVIKRASDSPTGLTSAGFAYNTAKGPWLALSSDGSVCAWISQGASRELFVRQLETVETTNEFQVTHDQRFTDTLNDSGVIAFFSPESLVCLVGDESGGEGNEIESGDFYRVDVDGVAAANDPQILNLSGTSGDSAVPFLNYGTLSNAGGVYRVPGFPGLLAMDDEAQSVVAVDWDGNVSTLVTGVDNINGLYLVGYETVLDVEMLGAGPDGEYSALYRLAPITSEVSLLGQLPPGGFFRQPAAFPGGYFAGVANAGGFEWLGRINVPAETTVVPLDIPAQYGPTQGFRPDGSLFFSIEFAGLTYFISWTATGWTLEGYHPQGFVLPGL